ncbi:hypothetical protein FZEAL_7263 [Fusarium zealandicum]|uniref:WSC domain-containing protein n=1 Tax=Fusarium zealandicum TaxID=1053134 RepID=A0A8H4UH42_9HYPO|nr:hypothetical protein FZEAL_7263 [Fusarium zealandicum]
MKVLTAILCSALAGRVWGLGLTDTITWGGDNSRTGYQTNHNMDPAVVGSSQFDIVFKTSLPGRYINAAESLFSQPLVYTPSGDTKQYVYLATTQNNLYKLDAKTGEILASRNIHIPFLTADLDGCVDVNPTVGVTATGVIDPATDTWYLTSKTYINQNGGQVKQGRPAGRYYVHAINVNDLTERPNFPINLEGLIASNNPNRMFTGGIHHQRPGLLNTGKYVYAGFASHCVQYNFTGWIIGWDKTTGKVVEQWATEGKGVGSDISGGGIWMSGGGLASDDAGSMFFGSGNGYASQLSTIPVNGFTPPTAMEQAAVHMSINDDGSLSVIDFFMPYEKQELDGADKDLGTSPLELLPNQFSCGDIKRIGVITGKSGKTYWLNLDDLGGYRKGANQKDRIIQTFQNENSVYAGAGVYPLEGGYIYINVIQYPTHVFKFSCTNGVPRFTKVADSPTKNAYTLGVSHGTTTSLNNQPGTGLLWVSDVQNTNFKIYDAIPKDGYLNVIRNFTIVGITKFSRPVFGDGMAYIGTTLGLFYGLGATNKVPLNCTSPVDFGTADFQDITDPKTITCKASFALSVSSIELTVATHYNISTLPTLPLTLSKGDSFTFKAQFFPKSVGRQGGTVEIQTTGVTDDSYSKTTRVRFTGVGKSSTALLSVSPKSVTFAGLVTGTDPDRETVLLGNDGSNQLQVSAVLYSTTSADGPFDTWTSSGSLKVGKFSLTDIPASINGGDSTAVSIRPDTSSAGNFQGWVKFVTTGGNGTVYMAASAGDPASARLEFQTPDGSGWVAYESGKPFTFGNVTENTSRSLRFRVTNNAAVGGVKLSLTVSKPPFGGSGIIRAVNQIDLAEGTLLAPGQSQTAVLTCIVPKSQWNLDPYNGTAQWTMNTNDPTWDKQFVQFFCNAVTEQAAPLLPNGLGQYRYVGCFKENNPGRQLPTLIYSNSSNTNELCINSCGAKGVTFCGSQYRRECWGGNKIPKLQVDDKNCNFDCAGSLDQICGGNGIDGGGAYISLFADTLSWDGTFGTIGGDDGPKGPFVNPGVYGYGSIGCYTEATSGRALPNGRGVETATVASCVQACKTGGFTYAGVEYGGECFCGNAFSAGSVPAPITECGMLCNGNGTEYCGGPNRLNVYQMGIAATVSSSTSPTTSTSSSSSSVPVSSSTSTTATLSTTSTSGTPTPSSSTSAVTASSSHHIFIFSLNFQHILKLVVQLVFNNTFDDSFYCSFFNNAGRAPVLVLARPEQRLPLLRQRRRQQQRLQPLQRSLVHLLLRPHALPPLVQLQPHYVLVDFTNIVIYDIVVHNAYVGIIHNYITDDYYHHNNKLCYNELHNNELHNNQFNHNKLYYYKAHHHEFCNHELYHYELQRCFTEGTSTRALNQKGTAKDDMTLENCAAFCDGYTYFGAEYGRECFCGNQLSTGSVKATNQKDCSFTCPGDKTQYCGAGNRLQLYRNTAVASTTTSSTLSSTTSTTTTTKAATPTVAPGNKNFTIYSCVSEPSNGRLLGRQVLNDGDMTIETCLDKCWMYKYAGVEYGRECWCGNTINLQGSGATPGKNVTMDDCNFKCPGDKLSFCGAGSRINMYINNSTALSEMKRRKRRHWTGIIV